MISGFIGRQPTVTLDMYTSAPLAAASTVCESHGSPPQPQSLPFDRYQLTLLVDGHVGMNNLSKVATWQCGGQGSNLQPLTHKSDALATKLSSHLYVVRSC